MTTSRTIENYGGPFVDASPVQDPNSEQSSAYANRCFEDVAQMSRTTEKAWCVFTTTTASAPTAADVIAGQSHAGSGSGQLPTVTKTATGCYTITYATSFTDGLDESENISFSFAHPSVVCATFCFPQIITIVDNVVTLELRSNVGALSDMSGACNIQLSLR